MSLNETGIKINSEKSIAVSLIYAFTICITVFFTIIFIVFNLNFEKANLGNTFILLIGIFSMLLVLFLTYKKKYKSGKYLVSTIPPFIIITLSILAKSSGFTDTIYLYLAPRMFTMVFLTVPVIFFGLNNLKELIISCAILLIPAIFFDVIHNAAGVYIHNLSYDSTTYIFLVLIISMMYLFIFVSILFFQKTGLKFRTRMKRFNAELIQEKTEVIALNKRLEFQASLYKVLNITSENKPINIILREVLDVVVNSDALTIDKKGVIFLTNDAGDLELTAVNSANELLKSCALVKANQCLCGKALARKEMIFCNHVGHEHTIIPAGMKPHGHYVIPIQEEGVVLGIINIYTKVGEERNDSVLAYLEAIASILAKKINAARHAELILNSKNTLNSTLIELNKGIQYASYLQKSLLPDQSTLNNYFQDCSVLYLPRDEVSGDFYFAKAFDPYIYFGVGDCTGHGIPGSLLASMSVEAVKQVILNNIGSTPDQLLGQLRDIASNRFKTNLDRIYGDSMDAALCLYNKETGILHYSGGFINLYVVDSDSNVVQYDATKCPVGSYEIEQAFDLHELHLKEGDTLYISSDGYYDQFGINPDSNRNKPEKYKRKRFLEFLKTIHKFDSQKQVDLLFEEIELWKNDLDQIDDITVMVLKN